MKYFSIVRVRVLSESENRRFTSTDFDIDLQAFKHEKSPMKSDFFGQISFLSPQYGAVWHNLYEPVLEETAVLSAVSISFSVFTMCSFVSFRCSGLCVKL